MASCRYCGLKVGLFRITHEACVEDAEAAIEQLRFVMKEAVTLGLSSLSVLPEVEALKRQGRLPVDEADGIALSAADSAALPLAHVRPVNDGTSEAVFNLFEAIRPNFLKDYKRYPGYISLPFSHTLFEVLHGRVPYFDPQITTGFQLKHDERPVLIRNAQLAEYKTVAQRGFDQSVSLPVGAGFYYRLSASTLRSEQTGLVLIDQGKMLITTQTIYFGGPMQNLRVPYSSVLRVESLVDGFGIYPDHGSGRVFIPATLGFDDGWFFCNLISAYVAQAKL